MDTPTFFSFLLKNIPSHFFFLLGSPATWIDLSFLQKFLCFINSMLTTMKEGLICVLLLVQTHVLAVPGEQQEVLIARVGKNFLLSILPKACNSAHSISYSSTIHIAHSPNFVTTIRSLLLRNLKFPRKVCHTPHNHSKHIQTVPNLNFSLHFKSVP